MTADRSKAPRWILERADELRAGDRDPRIAFDQAVQECMATGRGTRATVDALVGILQRAWVLHGNGHAPDDAIAGALNEAGASDDLAALARTAWTLDMRKGGSEATS